MDSNEDIGQIIRSRRKEQLRLTQDRVADMAGISKPYLSNIETGRAKNPPTDAVLGRLEKVLQFNPGELVEKAHHARIPAAVREAHRRQTDELNELKQLRSALLGLMNPQPPADARETHGQLADELKQFRSVLQRSMNPQPLAPEHVVDKQAVKYPAKEARQEEQDTAVISPRMLDQLAEWVGRKGQDTMVEESSSRVSATAFHDSFGKTTAKKTPKRARKRLRARAANKNNSKGTPRSREEKTEEAPFAAVESTENKSREGFQQLVSRQAEERKEQTGTVDFLWKLLNQLRQGCRAPIVNVAGAEYPRNFTDLGYPNRVATDCVYCPDVRDDQAFAVRVFGDAMSPKYDAGDIVVFSPDTAFCDGDDCFVRLADGTTTFHRVYGNGTTVRLQPLNTRYPAQILSRDQVTGFWPAVYRVVRLRK